MLSHILTWSLIPLTLRLAIPIAFGAIGGTFSERSGVMNLGLEGMMLMGSFGAVLGTYLTGSPYMGVLLALLIGAATGGIFALFSVRFKADQTVCGVGLNILASGFTTVMIKQVWGKEGMSGQVKHLDNITIPGLSKLPLIGGAFTDQSLFLYLLILVVILSFIVMYKSKVGLRLRAIGDNPRAAGTAGIPVKKYRYMFVTISGMLAALGGAYLSIVQNSIFVQDMVAGRGYMALAANIFGGWNPLGSFIASMIFAFAQALRFNLGGFGVPDQFIQMLPYVFTLLVLIIFRRKTRAPEALGEIYE